MKNEVRGGGLLPGLSMGLVYKKYTLILLYNDTCTNRKTHESYISTGVILTANKIDERKKKQGEGSPRRRPLGGLPPPGEFGAGVIVLRMVRSLKGLRRAAGRHPSMCYTRAGAIRRPLTERERERERERETAKGRNLVVQKAVIL